MNDIFKVTIFVSAILFTDDITIIFNPKNFNKFQEIVNTDLKQIFDLFNFNKLVANLSKSNYLLIGCDS